MNKDYASLKRQAIDYRLKDRKSIESISKILQISQSTCSSWLKPYPLTSEEIKERNIANGRKSGQFLKENGSPLRYDQGETNVKTIAYKLSLNEEYTTSQKGKIAESAVIFRLVLRKFEIYKSIFDGDKVDLVIQNPKNSELIKIQVRWAGKCRNGQRTFKLTCSDGRKNSRKYDDNEFDFIIGYSIDTDMCYVYSCNDLHHLKKEATLSKEHSERWDKVEKFDTQSEHI